MRTKNKILLASSCLVAASLGSRAARAQLDTNPPIPDVLLLIDTSGSMEKMIDGTDLDTPPGNPNACQPGVSTLPNRWASVLGVLTGDIQNFSCQAIDRTSAAFKVGDYAFQGQVPYDAGYYLPYHRPLSTGNCGPAPGTSIVGNSVNLINYWDWPNGSIGYHSDVNNNPCTTFDQLNNGLLDTFRDRVRFGLMTFDTLPDAGTGRTGGNAPDAVTGFKGMWSYMPGWNTGAGTPAQGWPANCNTPLTYEVGARNAAAPPWEGRMIPFGPFNATLAQNRLTNQHIQQALLAVRPYGATPLAGMLTDAQYFFWNDTTNDPSTPGYQFGPGNDPYWNGGCREAYQIIITDGAPNQDMRPFCQQMGAPNGSCPYLQPDAIVNNLATNPPAANIKVYTAVIGFALDQITYPGGPFYCDQNPVLNAVMNNTALPDGKFCGSNTPANITQTFQQCCVLEKMALAGDPQANNGALPGKFGNNGHAFFASNAQVLKQQLSSILASISSASTSRTYPIFANISAGTAQAAQNMQASPLGNAPASGYQFLSSFSTKGPIWTGSIQRERFVCNGVNLQLPGVVNPSLGDDFTRNVDIGDSANPRQFWTAVGSVNAGQIYSMRSLRPNSPADGLGIYNWVGTPQPASRAIFEGTSPLALGIPAAPPSACSSNFGVGTNQISCSTKTLQWYDGSNAMNGLTIGTPPQPMPSRNINSTYCTQYGPCSQIGSVYHSTPVVVGAPQDFLRDETYSVFATSATGPCGGIPCSLRDPVLYAATIDGQLHAFKVASGGTPADPMKVDTDQVNNELWSFIPPYVLPQLLGNYNSQSVLLDGAPAVKDVIFDRDPSTVILDDQNAAHSGWHTVLVAGGGVGGGFYYALEVTDPHNPKFLWQLATDQNGVKLFGDIVPTPAITTVNVKIAGVVHEVATAVLAGGQAQLATCPPGFPNGAPRQSNVPQYTNKINLFKAGDQKLRTGVQCWGGGPGAIGPAASVTLARIDDGTVLMNFRAHPADGPAGVLNQKSGAYAPSSTTGAPFDSPMSGIPVPFPAGTGQVASRIYMGDSDGTLWRVDVSDTDPANWNAAPVWDAFSFATDTWNGGQPIQVPPVVTVDQLGNPIVLFSTGDQENIGSSVEQNRLWSIIDKPDTVAGGFVSTANWVVPFQNGMRVTGPLSLYQGSLFFATFTPLSVAGASCQDGYGSIWAVDYKSSTMSPSIAGHPDVIQTAGAFPALVPLAPAPLNTAWLQDLPAGEVTFGVAVTQLPTCATDTVFPDPYYGGVRAVNGATAGAFQLVFHTGRLGAPATANAKTNATTMTLPPPRQTTRVDSWASIIE